MPQKTYPILTSITMLSSTYHDERNDFKCILSTARARTKSSYFSTATLLAAADVLLNSWSNYEV